MKKGIITCLLCTITIIVKGQSCLLPILSSIDSLTQSSAKITWLDLGNADYFEIEYGQKNFVRTGEPVISDIFSKEYTLSNLSTGTTYEVYIRSVCGSITSDWNGPYFFNTVISNNQGCLLELSITDNNCPTYQNFEIEVITQNDAIIGRDITLRAVDLSVSHTWPPDLTLILQSPDGTRALLSENNGNGIDNYGNPADSTCRERASFTDEACVSVDDWIPPYIGSFNSEENLNEIFAGESASGIWSLSICDRAQGDIGYLSYLKLIFDSQPCGVPQDFRITDIEGDQIDVRWDSYDVCEFVKISYRVLGAPDDEYFFEFIECGLEEFTITDLLPDTEYEIFITAQCADDEESLPSCISYFKTLCRNSLQSHDFDQRDLCNNVCDTICAINEFWSNVDTLQIGWSINRGSTATDFTGPDDDVSAEGNYIYVESSSTSCIETLAILESRCIESVNSSDCSISFYYHMYGNDIGKLELQYSQGSKWITFWEKEGNQGNDWIQESVNLQATLIKSKLRFVTTVEESGSRGDIALDNIKLIDIDTTSLVGYYVDADNDGYGDPDGLTFLCATLAPSGYSGNSLDCDDSNADINPRATEIRCNLIDENCNGNQDDIDTDDLSYQINNIRPESCFGEANGSISITAINGQEPYTYEWSNGASTPSINNLESGIYTCTIYDNGGCLLVTEPIAVSFDDILVYSVASIDSPSCFGLDDGEISILINGGIPPYNVLWSNGLVGDRISNIESGKYQATIMDVDGCSVITDSIIVRGSNVLTTGIMLSRDVDCNEGDNGLLQVGIAGGSPPYNITWSNGETSPTNRNLSAGDYSVTIEDNIGCISVIKDVRVSQPNKVALGIRSVEDITCYGESSGIIDVITNGGTPPYSYFWSNGGFNEDLINVRAGSYSLTVIDFNSCQTILEDIEISEPDILSIDITELESVNCISSNNGNVEIAVQGGSPPYFYNWSTQESITSNLPTQSNLSAGIYSVTVVDQFGCKSVPFSFEIENRNVPIEMQVSIAEGLLCFGDSTANIELVVENGLSPYDINWSNGRQSIRPVSRDTADNLISGSYNVTVTDAEGCIGISDSIIINSPDEITYTVIQKLNNQCWYDRNGSITLEADGGNAPYKVVWSDGQEGLSISDLPIGEYRAIIEDKNGCSVETTGLIIDGSPEIEVSAEIEVQNNLGIIRLTVSGGTPPIMYNWAAPISFEQDAVVTDLTPGEYAVTISDQNNCEIDTFFTIDITDSVTEIDRKNNLFELYPNPAFDHALVKSKGYKIESVKIINTQGQVISDYKEIDSSEIKLDLSGRAQGLYWVQIMSAETRVIYPLVILSSF